MYVRRVFSLGRPPTPSARTASRPSLPKPTSPPKLRRSRGVVSVGPRSRLRPADEAQSRNVSRSVQARVSSVNEVRSDFNVV